MSEQKQYYDFSEYPKDHFLYNTDNQAVVGLMKDEYHSKIITEFIGLRSKLYSITAEGEEPKDNKKVVMKHKMNLIKSSKHQLNTVKNITFML